jgi:hypothetical protein
MASTTEINWAKDRKQETEIYLRICSHSRFPAFRIEIFQIL